MVTDPERRFARSREPVHETVAARERPHLRHARRVADPDRVVRRLTLGDVAPAKIVLRGGWSVTDAATNMGEQDLGGAALRRPGDHVIRCRMAWRAIVVGLLVSACSSDNRWFGVDAGTSSASDGSTSGSTTTAPPTSAADTSDSTTQTNDDATAGTTVAMTTDVPPDLPSATTTTITATTTATTTTTTDTTRESDSDGPGDLPPCDPADERLIACYDFEPAPNEPKHLFDGSAYQNHGIIVAPAYSPGVTGDALDIGADTKATAPDSASLSPAALTVAAWVRLSALPMNTATVVAKAGQYSLAVISDGGVACSFGGLMTTFNNVLVVDTWTHLACTYEAGTLKIYIDGLQSAQGSSDPFVPMGAAPLTIGCGGDECEVPLVGASLDRVRLWDVALAGDDLCVEAGC
jgi:hypothetical protein